MLHVRAMIDLSYCVICLDDISQVKLKRVIRERRISMKRSILALLAMVLLVIACVGCGPSNSADEGLNTQTSDRNDNQSDLPSEDADEEITFTFSLPYDISLNDPQNAVSLWDYILIINTHEPLVRMDAKGNIIPALAEKWEVSEDNLQCRFYLRKDVKFQDGTPVTASDVKYSMERAKTKPYAARALEFYKDISIVNNHEFVLNMNFPSVPFLKTLTQTQYFIVSEKSINAFGEENYSQNANGAGPFKVQEWKMGDKIVLVANENYYLGKPDVDQLIIRTIKETNTAVIALENNEVDSIINVPSMAKQQIVDNPNLNYDEVPSVAGWTLSMNCQMPPFDNQTLRMAIAHAVNQQEIINVALDGAGLVRDIMIHESSNGFVPEFKRWPYDIENAKVLMKQAGYENGLDTTIYVREDFTQKIGQVLQQQLKKININLDVVVMERGAWVDDMRAGKLTMYPVGLGDMILDAEQPLRQMSSPKGNTCHWVNKEYDRLFEALVKETDTDERTKIITEMLNIEKEDVPRVPMFFQISNIAYNNKFTNIEAYPTNLYFFFPYSLDK